MSDFEPNGINEVKNLINYFNQLHDASLRKITFFKKRDLDPEDGSLIYHTDNLKDLVICDVQIELLLNSYGKAKKDQTVLLEFFDARAFQFFQEEDFDYSEVYHLECDMDNNLFFEF